MSAEANYSVIIGRPYKKALTTNNNDSSFASKVAKVAEPINDGVVALTKDGAIVPFRVFLLPYGLGTSNDAFSMRVIGWRHIGAYPNWLWIPTPLFELACVLGANGGVAGSPILNTELFVDTITVVSEPTITADTTRQGTVQVYSPANDTAAFAVAELYGVEKIEFTFDQTTQTPTMNCLVAFL